MAICRGMWPSLQQQLSLWVASSSTSEPQSLHRDVDGIKELPVLNQYGNTNSFIVPAWTTGRKRNGIQPTPHSFTMVSPKESLTEDRNTEVARWIALLIPKLPYLTGKEACSCNKIFAENEILQTELNILLRTSSKTWSWEELSQGAVQRRSSLITQYKITILKMVEKSRVSC